MGLFLLILSLDDNDPEDHGDSTPLQPGSLTPAGGCSGQLATVTQSIPTGGKSKAQKQL